VKYSSPARVPRDFFGVVIVVKVVYLFKKLVELVRELILKLIILIKHVRDI